MNTNTGPRAPQAGSGNRPGQMTMAMRAMPQVTGPKVLRIGKVQGGRVIEERVVKQRTHVTIGSSHTNMFLASGQGVPESMRLFELVGNEYVLNLTDAMTGRVALPAGVTDVAQARASGLAKRVGAHCQLKLTEEARGKVVLGDTTFLFQFVAPPPIQPKPQLPLAVKGGLAAQVDWGFTIIAAFSFLFHFGFAGAVNSEWFDPIVDEEAETASLIQSTREHPAPPPLEDKKPDVKSDDKSKSDEKGKADEKTAKTNTPTPKNGPAPSKAEAAAAAKAAAGKASEAKADALSSQADTLALQLLGGPGGEAPAVGRTLKSGDTAAADHVDRAATDTSSVDASGGPKLRGQAGGGPTAPGALPGSNDISKGGSKTTGAGTPTAAPTAVEGPKVPTITSSEATTSAPNVPGADAVVAKNKWRFRGCYSKALQSDPDAGGTVSVTVSINAEGKVTSASGSGGSPPSLATCVAGTFYSMTFSPPDGGSATFTVKAVFAAKK